MAISTYDITVPTWVRALTGLSWELVKAERQYRAEGRNIEDLLDDRLAEDMWPLRLQLAMALNHSKGAADRILGRAEPDTFLPAFPSVEAAHGGLADAIAELRSLTPGQLAENETRVCTWDPGKTGGFSFTGGAAYWLEFAQFHFWFHNTTAYAIMRKNGVGIGKRDYMAREAVRPEPLQA